MGKVVRTNNTQQQNIVKMIDGLCGAYSKWQIWNDFITLAAVSIANVLPNSQHDKREQMYMQVAQKYTRDELMKFAAMRDEIVDGMEQDPDQDFLGELFMALGLGNEWGGQFFTPYSVCRVMAGITLNAEYIKGQIADNGFASAYDPACGAGALLLAFANECHKPSININYQTSVLFIAQDIDLLAGLMCYIQLSYMGCPGYVAIGDTLASPCVHLDKRGLIPADETNAWYTPMFYSDIWQGRQLCARMDLMARQGAATVQREQQSRCQNAAEPDGQLTLF